MLWAKLELKVARIAWPRKTKWTKVNQESNRPIMAMWQWVYWNQESRITNAAWGQFVYDAEPFKMPVAFPSGSVRTMSQETYPG